MRLTNLADSRHGGKFGLLLRDRNQPVRLSLIILCMSVWLMVCVADGVAGDSGGIDDTLLIFVGEELDVLSIATRREESAWQAPAVAKVITAQQIREGGVLTLSEALSTVPGFYMADKEWGIMPYMRGIPNSVLFLHDTVPMGSDVNKSLNPIGHELPLTAIKRIEIIRGPGSVLWGPDAFAGIVNVVPLSGKDFEGIETGLSMGTTQSQKGGYVNLGHDSGSWDAFASLSARSEEGEDRPYNVVNFWQDSDTPVPPEDRFGIGTVDTADYVDALGAVSLGNCLSATAKASLSETPYSLTGDDGEMTWPEERRVSSGYVKVEGKKETSRNAAIRVLGSYSWLNPDWKIIDLTLNQEENTVYGELLYDQSFFDGIGLLTTGVSYREKRVTDAPIWDGYLYDYLGPLNEYFVPGLTLADYESSLRSVFGQYTHKINKLELLGGIRYDDHDAYEDNVSFNGGGVWRFSRALIFKLLYGTAYRTPFSHQLLADEASKLEKIKSFTAQIGWHPSDDFNFSLTGFYNEIENHIMQDQFAGLSLPNRQETQGAEFDIQWNPFRALELRGNMTIMDHSGPNEIYKYNDYSTINPDDGTVEKHYVDLSYPYDAGPDTLINLMGVWRPSDSLSMSFRIYHISSRPLIFPRGGQSREISGVWLADTSLLCRDILTSGFDMRILLKNIMDEDYETPGTYYVIKGEPFRAEISFSKKW
ncbi:MAG: TonB-dependent receptor plug domain-containing protein [Desulfobacterales bacterium]|jgi:outer membrane receptor for ferrienterochelin and colicin|nr:TonB-dependent receptor plug domain-containing protein [Desulfobacterales bacterium]